MIRGEYCVALECSYCVYLVVRLIVAAERCVLLGCVCLCVLSLSREKRCRLKRAEEVREEAQRRNDQLDGAKISRQASEAAKDGRGRTRVSLVMVRNKWKEIKRLGSG